jgi:hypothetical protein
MIHRNRDCQPSTSLTVSYWTLLTMAIYGENCESLMKRMTFDVKLPSAG